MNSIYCTKVPLQSRLHTKYFARHIDGLGEIRKSLVEKGYHSEGAGKVWERKGDRNSIAYSDGDEAEERVLKIITKARDRSLFSRELAAQINDWPTLYHLSSSRANLLRPLLSRLQGPVLEIGAGCGAITRFLGESGLVTVALEGSSRRARIAATRCEDLDCVTVVSETLQDFAPIGQFKTVIMIGVLEYARMFFPSPSVDPVNSMLTLAREFLSPEGSLVLAIENQLGLKYLLGYPEDHYGVAMVGVEDRYSENGPVTFGRKELDRRLALAGFAQRRWLFPFPDYKLPATIISEEGLAAEGSSVFLSNLVASSAMLEAQRPSHTEVSLRQAWFPVVRNGLTGELANSFLVMASKRLPSAKPEGELAWHYDYGRLKSYAKELKFLRRGEKVIVERRPLSPAWSAENETKSPLRLHLEDETYRPGQIWADQLESMLIQPGWTCQQIAEWLRVWVSAIRKEELPNLNEPLSLTTCLPGRLLDAVPKNLVVSADGETSFIDLEWDLSSGIEFGFLLFRALVTSLGGIYICDRPERDVPQDYGGIVLDVASRLGFEIREEDLILYSETERRFQSQVCGLPVASSVCSQKLPIRGESVQQMGDISFVFFKLTEKIFPRNSLRRRFARAFFSLCLRIYRIL
jgi:2-polyprenyl-3-methyl-5-hydroxy-6-metoxy-1,4-benzoquinol methylase